MPIITVESEGLGMPPDVRSFVSGGPDIAKYKGCRILLLFSRAVEFLEPIYRKTKKRTGIVINILVIGPKGLKGL